MLALGRCTICNNRQCKCRQTSSANHGASGGSSRRQFLRAAAGRLTALAAALASLAGCNSLPSTAPATGGDTGDGLDIGGGGGGGGGGGNDGDGPLPDPLQIDISGEDFRSLSSVGGVVELPFEYKTGLPPDGVFLVRSASDEVTVLNRGCTHQGCRVLSFDEQGVATCPCHNSRFDMQGNVLQGPATEPLISYDAELLNDVVTIYDL